MPDGVAERTLPHNLEAERSVLGAILLHNDAFNLAAEVIDSADFFRDAHRRIFDKMVKLVERGDAIDLVTLKEELGRSGERRVVADRHDVVEPVDADALAAQAVREPLARTVGELLVGDLGVAVQTDVARLAREDDRRLSREGNEDVGVAVHDREPGDVGHSPFEARVLRAADERGVETVAGEGGLDVRAAPAQFVHESSTPFTSAQIAWFSGVGTACSRPKRTIPPFK